jgi:hypothetical protein
MSNKLELRQIWKTLTGKSEASSVHVVSDRFQFVFQSHGVEVAQIPRLMTCINLNDLSTPDHLLAVLTPGIIDQAAQLFKIRTQWLEGVEDQIYEYLGTYKEPKELLSHIARLTYPPGGKRHFPLRVLTTSMQLDRNADRHQILAPVLLEPITELGDEMIYRYHVYRDGFDWNHYPSRIELKAIARILFYNLGTPVPLFQITEAEMEEVLEGLTIPKRLLRGALVTNPSLEDYALSSKESGVAKEIEELPEVLQYIEEHGLHDFSFGVVDEKISSSDDIEPIETLPFQDAPAQPKRPRVAEMWEPIRNAAQTLWDQDKQLPIAEVVRRIKRTSSFKASAFTESAIRKHIVDLAPVGVRGKSGRKPNQTTSLMTQLIQQELDK